MSKFHQRREKSSGKSFPNGMDQLQHETDAPSKSLGKTEKQTHADQFLAYRSPEEQNTSKRMGQRKQKKHQLTIDKAISEMIQSGLRKNMLEKLEMFFISVNYFCKTHTADYIPAEMAIIRYNLEGGILGKFHELINPVKLPLGLAYEASEHSEESHALPIPPNALGQNDYSVVLQNILAFTGYNKPNKLFPLFTNANEVAVVESVLAQLNKQSKTDYHFLVISLGEFFYHLKRGTEKSGLDVSVFWDQTIAELLLKNDEYEYTTEIACDFHVKQGNPQFCSLSKACRWTYIISHNCCPDLSINLLSGCHCPSNVESLHLSKSTLSSTILDQIDGMSVTSSALQSNLTLPQIQKADVEQMDSFYMVESVYGSISPSRGTGKQTKLIPVHQPTAGRGRGLLLSNHSDEPSSIGLCVPGAGEGRGENSSVSGLQGAGRGRSLMMGWTGIDPADRRVDSVSTVHARGTTRRQSRRTASYRARL